MTTEMLAVREALEKSKAEIERLRALIPAAKEAREVAACFFRVLSPKQIDIVLCELDEMGFSPCYALVITGAR